MLRELNVNERDRHDGSTTKSNCLTLKTLKIMANVLTNSDPDPKKAIWKFILQTAISVLTAILTALGATSCVTHYL